MTESLNTENGSKHLLNSTWNLYWHDRKNQDWSPESYRVKYIIKTVEDFWTVYNNFRTVAHDMFFLMREGYPPIWEDKKNINGGGLCFRIQNKEVDNFWLIASLLLIGETVSESPTEVVGLSVSPKLKNTTIRLWYRDTKTLDTIKSTLHPELLRISHDFIIRPHKS